MDVMDFDNHLHQMLEKVSKNKNKFSWEISVLIYLIFLTVIWLPHSLPTSGHYRGSSLIHLMLITVLLHFWPEGHREPCNKVWSLSQAKLLMGFEPGTFRFWLQCLNPLGYSPQLESNCSKMLSLRTFE